MRKLNRRIYLGFAVTLAMVASSCVDDTMKDYTTTKPEKLQQYEYLANYDVLKNYVDRSANPNFKLGIGVSADDFLKGGLVYAMTCSNFDEVTAGNEMKSSSIVDKSGNMDFGTVKKLVNAAKTAGITIYGHTLAWHAQQPTEWLNSLIANRKEVADPGVSILKSLKGGASNLRSVVVRATAKVSETYDNQFFITSPTVFNAGDVTHISFRYRADKEASIGSQCHAAPGGYIHWSAIGNVNFTAEWQEFDMDFTIPAECDGKNMRTIAFNLNDFAGANNYYFDDIVWTKDGVDYITNGDCEGEDVSSFRSTISKVGPNSATIEEIAMRSFVVRATAKVSEAWDNQFFITSPTAFNAGDVTKISFRYKADKDASVGTQCHAAHGDYIHWSAIGNVNFTTEWHDFSMDFTIPAECDGKNMRTIAFNLNDFAGANNYYIVDVKWEKDGVDYITNGDCKGEDVSCFYSTINKVGPSPATIEEVSLIAKPGGVIEIPLTDEEKKTVLTDAMDSWISGMMKACEGYVTAWDVVNEPLSGADTDGDGLYDLQSAKTASKDEKKNNFYWQDYLGSDDYVRTAVKLARKYFAENGGVADNLKLFINDYNLESDWDDNGKLKSLIEWIERWEEDGTKIDGIGTQMHVSYFVNPTDQKSKEDHIVKMFELLATSGKLIKISELDMGIVGEDGKAITTDKVTEEQHKAMSEFYKFIIKKYFEIIPASQRYGITQWAATDSPSDSGWRAKEPIGLWDLNFSRKHTYAGFADGLSNK